MSGKQLLLFSQKHAKNTDYCIGIYMYMHSQHTDKIYMYTYMYR